MGLGNPGPEYRESRHNAGQLLVERLAATHRLRFATSRPLLGRLARGRVGGAEVALLVPETYMNLSGRAVERAVPALGIDDPARDLVLVYDDLALPYGKLRLRPGGSAGGHRGVADIQARLGRDDLPRLRFGIGGPAAGADTVAYVLAPFSPDELARLDGLLDRGADALEALVGTGLEAAMNRFNPDPEPAR